jgi:phosphatidylinositol-4,5-bisphosphate 3-kinase
LLRCTDWTDPYSVDQMHQLLDQFEPFEKPIESLELMDWEFSDPVVREFAINKYFEKLSDWDLSNYMLQLGEILRQELYHFSPFSIFLLKRALRNPHMVGHKLFWVLKSQLHLDTVRERFALMLEYYISNVGEKYRIQLKDENQIIEDILDVAMKVKVQCWTKGLKEKGIYKYLIIKMQEINF